MRLLARQRQAVRLRAVDYRFNKVRDLTSMLGAEHRVVSETTPQSHYAAMLGGDLEPEISRRIAVLRDSSTRYLDHVLQ